MVPVAGSSSLKAPKLQQLALPHARSWLNRGLETQKMTGNDSFTTVPNHSGDHEWRPSTRSRTTTALLAPPTKVSTYTAKSLTAPITNHGSLMRTSSPLRPPKASQQTREHAALIQRESTTTPNSTKLTACAHHHLPGMIWVWTISPAKRYPFTAQYLTHHTSEAIFYRLTFNLPS